MTSTASASRGPGLAQRLPTGHTFAPDECVLCDRPGLDEGIELGVIDRAFLVNRHRRRIHLAATGNLANVAAFRITGTTIERSEAAALELHLLAAQLAGFDLFFTICGTFG